MSKEPTLAEHQALVRRLGLTVRYYRDEQCGVKAFAREVIEVMDLFAADPAMIIEGAIGESIMANPEVAAVIEEKLSRWPDPSGAMASPHGGLVAPRGCKAVVK